MVLNDMTMQEAFDVLKTVPDLKVAKNDPVLFIHRRLNTGDIYFISNQNDQPIKIKATSM